MVDKAYTAVFVLSFICATSGFFMVVVFTYIYVIPYRISKERLFTQCLVTAFFRLHQSEHQNCTGTQTGMRSLSPAHNVMNGSYCVGVKVMYKQLDATWHYGVVSLEKPKAHVIEVQNSSFVPPCCPASIGSCTVFTSADNSANNNGVINRVPAYYNTPPPTAPSGGYTCHLKLGAENYQPVSLAQQLRCFYSEAPTMARVVETLPSHPVIVNIILWPTVLFIVGFVGMFFSCIKMQYGGQSNQPQRPPEHRTPTLL